MAAATKKPRKDSGGVEKTRSVEEIYQKKTQLEHILLRPDSYVGSTEMQSMDHWIFDNKTSRMVRKRLEYIPALYKIFDEILVNAADNLVRCPEQNHIMVEIRSDQGYISVYNNGAGLPVVLHKDHNCFVPELVFGHLLTSDNYDDSEKKVTGGRNGYGAKLTNIFSTKFVLETQDGTGKRYKQVWEKNMGICHPPEIAKGKGEPFTKVTFYPDLTRFQMKKLDDDITALMRRRAYDVAAATHGRCGVTLDGEPLEVSSFEDYVALHLKPDAFRVYQVVNDRWEIAVGITDGSGFQQVSFVNSINTSRGGTHVNYVADQVVNAVHDQLSKSKSTGTLAIKHQTIRGYFIIFVNCLIENPAFDSQTKETLTSKRDRFGSVCEVPESMLQQVLESGLLDVLTEWSKQMGKSDLAQHLNRSDFSMQKRLHGIPKLDDANMAGTKGSSECTLILTEGDSAKALAVAGLSVIGRDRYGVFPLRGKLRNVRELTIKQMMENKEIEQLLKIMALDATKSYESPKGLRYGSIMIMTDQDLDGSHIKGLIINFIEKWFPSLLKVPGFIKEFVTPIVKVSKGDEVITFFTLYEYENWKRDHDDAKGWKVKYYKGLGTSTSQEAKEYFSDLDTHQLSFVQGGDQDNDLIDMAFNTKRADDRKSWISNCQEDACVDHSQSEISYTDFINKELVLFAKYDVERAIPNIMDGFKAGQRKVLFGAFKKNITHDIKVAQFSGYVAEHSAYHHGESSLQGTIVSLAQCFVGSNNINLLVPSGQFGTRLQGGKDHAAARYIFTRLNRVTRCLFPEDDDAVLDPQSEEGLTIEPRWYAPVIPTVLVNGAEGIGTGWSTSIPNYNPREILANVRRCLKKMPLEPMVPWYRGFTGSIAPSGVAGKYDVCGKAVKRGRTRLEITELPIKRWTQDYKEWLVDQLPKPGAETRGTISEVREHHTENTVHFVLSLTPDKLAEAERRGVERVFHLKSSISTTNMFMFAADGKLKKYNTPEEVIEEFVPERLEIYRKRKEHMLRKLARELAIISNRLQFVRLVVDGTLDVDGKKASKLTAQMREHGLQTMREIDGGDAPERPEDLLGPSGYKYLLSMKIWSLTEDKLAALTKLHAEKTAAMEALLSTTLETLWERDLVRLEDALDACDKEDAKEAEIAAKMAAKAMGGELSLVNQQCVIVLSSNFTAKRVRASEWKARNRGKALGKKCILDKKDKDAEAEGDGAEDAAQVDSGLAGVFCCFDFDALLVFTEDGMAIMMQALDIPLAKRISAPSSPLSDFAPELGSKAKIATLITVPQGALKDKTDDFVVLITEFGMAKKVCLSSFRGLRPGKVVLAMKVSEGDSLRWAHRASANCALVLATRLGNALRTPLGSNWAPASMKSGGRRVVKMRSKCGEAIASTAIHTLSEVEIRGLKIEFLKKNLARPKSDADQDATPMEGVENEAGTQVQPSQAVVDEDEKEEDADECVDEDADEVDDDAEEADDDVLDAVDATESAREVYNAINGTGEEHGIAASSDLRTVLFVTAGGMGLRTPLVGKRLKLAKRGKCGISVMKLSGDDEVVSVAILSGVERSEKPRAPLNAFMLWFKDHKDEVKDQDLSLGGPVSEGANATGAAEEQEGDDAGKTNEFQIVYKAREFFKNTSPETQKEYAEKAEEDAKRYAQEMDEHNSNQVEELLIGSVNGCVSRITVESIPVVHTRQRGKVIAKLKGDKICAASLLSSIDVDRDDPAAAPSAPSKASTASRQPRAPSSATSAVAAASLAIEAPAVSSTNTAGAPTDHANTVNAEMCALTPSTPPRLIAGVAAGELPPLSLTPPGASSRMSHSLRKRIDSDAGTVAPWLRGRLSRMCRSPRPPTPGRSRMLPCGARSVKIAILKPNVKALGTARFEPSVVTLDMAEWARCALAASGA